MIRLKKISILLICFICFQTAKADWVKQNANTLAWLHDIYFFNETHGLIVGGNGAFLETKDGGKTWAKRAKFTEDKILQISFSDEYNGWLLCERDVFNRGANALSYLMKTTDGGVNWEKVDFKDVGRARITKIFFNQKGKGFAIGERGTIFEFQADGIWQKSSLPILYYMLGGVFSDENHGAIVGAGGSIYFTEDAGANWNQANIFGDKTAKLNSVFFANQRGGWTVGANGKIFQTQNGGKMWREQKSGVGSDLSDVFFANTAEGWAVGDSGTILHTKTAGNVWNLEETGIKHRLERILLVGQKVFAVGFGGTVLVSDGKTLKSQAVFSRRDY